MNQSTRRRVVARAAKDAKTRLLMGIRCVSWLAVLAFAMPPALAGAQSSCPGIRVKVLNIESSRGTVACALFESPDGFPKEYLRHATNVMVTKIRDTIARCDFRDIPPGTYALVVVHDENRNGELDTNWLGIPKESYGFSSDASASLAAPAFSAASFPYDGESLESTVELHY